jgi:hypothetical protein
MRIYIYIYTGSIDRGHSVRVALPRTTRKRARHQHRHRSGGSDFAIVNPKAVFRTMETRAGLLQAYEYDLHVRVHTHECVCVSVSMLLRMENTDTGTNTYAMRATALIHTYTCTYIRMYACVFTYVVTYVAYRTCTIWMLKVFNNKIINAWNTYFSISSLNMVSTS